MSGVIVVAVDPLTGSRDALRWAAQEARLRRARLHAVMPWRPPRPPAAPAARPPVVAKLGTEHPQRDADVRLDEIIAAALGADHKATCEAVQGPTLAVLLGAASDADLLVLDPPHLTNLTRARASILTPQLVFKAPCPVVVIPPR